MHQTMDGYNNGLLLRAAPRLGAWVRAGASRR